MKRAVCFIAAILLFIALTGCDVRDKKGQTLFYYPRAEYAFERSDGVIAAEIREEAGYRNVTQLLVQYLEGPADPTLVNPFPEDVELVSVHTDGDTLHITVTDHMAKLSGAPLILACACLGETGMALSGTSTAQIRCQTLLLDGKKAIIVDVGSILYFDELSAVGAAGSQE